MTTKNIVRVAVVCAVALALGYVAVTDVTSCVACSDHVAVP